jgi:hypothetical protein
MTELEQQIAALQLFNEKAQRLAELSFVKAVTDPNAGVTISIQLEEDGNYEWSSVVRGPSREAVEAFVLTFRYFIQDNEAISLRNIAALYEAINVDQQLKDWFKSARNAINKLLDSPNFMNINYNGTTPTNREVMCVFVYGGLAHANPQKYKRFQEWMSAPPASALMQNCFNIILGQVLHAIVYISKVNEKAMEQLAAHK